MKIPVMIFAAGRGTRMRELTQDRPKPMVCVNGTPLIDHAIARTRTPAVSHRVVNVHHFADLLQHHLRNAGVLVSDERDDLLETGGGLRKAMPLLDQSPVFTMNSDALWVGPDPFSCLIDAWRDEMEGLLLLAAPEQRQGHLGTGDFTMAEDGRITRQGDLVYTGLQIIRTDRLATIEDRAFSLNAVWQRMIAHNTLFGVVYSGQWCDVGQPESIPLAEALLRGERRV